MERVSSENLNFDLFNATPETRTLMGTQLERRQTVGREHPP